MEPINREGIEARGQRRRRSLMCGARALQRGSCRERQIVLISAYSTPITVLYSSRGRSNRVVFLSFPFFLAPFLHLVVAVHPNATRKQQNCPLSLNGSWSGGGRGAVRRGTELIYGTTLSGQADGHVRREKVTRGADTSYSERGEEPGRLSPASVSLPYFPRGCPPRCEGWK